MCVNITIFIIMLIMSSMLAYVIFKTHISEVGVSDQRLGYSLRA